MNEITEFELDLDLPPNILRAGPGDAPVKRKSIRDELVLNLAVRAKTNFLAYVMLTNPGFQIGPHHYLLAKKLEELANGKTRRLMFFLPPRASKSTMTSVYFPAWIIGRHPRWEMMGISYSSDLSIGFSREVRNLITSDAHRLVFPDSSLRPDSKAAGRWHTKDGGVYVAQGTTGGIAGKGANVLLIDDPISEQDAYSKAKRESVNNWYPTARQRLNAAGRVAIIMTRWHHDDLAGHLLDAAKKDKTADQWDVVDVPAILDPQEFGSTAVRAAELLDLPLGSSFWPPTEEGMRLIEEEGILAGWPLDELLRTKANTPPYLWKAQYGQNPTTEEGAILKRSYWKIWDEPKPPECHYKLISMDTAYSEKEEADFTAITVWGVFIDRNHIHNLVLLGAERDRWEYPDLRKHVDKLWDKWNPDTFLVEKKASGQALVPDLRRAGIPVLAFEPGDRDKVARAHVCTPIFHAGRIWAPEKRWADDVMEECAQFPFGAHDDYVDTVTQAVFWLKDGTWVVHPDDDYDESDSEPSNKRRKFY